jgi:type II secretory pathway component PulC
VIALATTALGCASSSATTSDGADEAVSSEPPSAEEDTQKPLPRGPDVEVGKARVDASDGQSADQEDETNQDEAQQNEAQQNEAQQDESAATVSRSDVQAFMQKGPSYALTMVDVAPERSDGEFQGFKVTTMTPGAASAVSGQLQTGDVITHINGVRMQKPDDYLNAWKLLSEVTKIRIDFVRDGSAEHAVWLIE